MSVFLFLVVLFVLILVHEWGHYIVAKKTGMLVEEFGIGFPPRLLKKRWGETLYTFNAIPIGGFVRILGENYETESVHDQTTPPQSADSSRSFSARPKWAQALVLIAGVTMNVLFAWLLFSIVFMLGTEQAVDESMATEAAALYFVGALPEAPVAQLPVGAEITNVRTAVADLETLTPSGMIAFVESAGAVPITISYLFQGEPGTIEVTPVRGLNPEKPDSYAIGASITLIEEQRLALPAAVIAGLGATANGLVAITVGLFTLISQSLVGTADFSQIAGPVGIVSLVGDAASFGVSALLIFTAIISLNLAVINLLPFPALDGGRLVFVGIEAVTGKQIPSEWAGRINLVGFALLMILMVAVTYNDVIKLLQ